MEQEIYDLRETIGNKNPLVRLFFKWKFNKSIRIANLKKEDVILDFGCGGKYLKNKLKDFNVISYDSNPEFTEIRDYTKTKPTKIFAIDVFEHLSMQEIEKAIKNFKEMSNNFVLITAIPNENWFWRLSRLLLGLSPSMKDHITNINEIVLTLNKEFNIKKKVCFFYVTYIYKFENDML